MTSLILEPKLSLAASRKLLCQKSNANSLQAGIFGL